MKRLLLLGSMAAIAVAAVALIGFRSSGGPDVAHAAGPQIVLDLVEGTGWCNTIDDTATVTIGTTHKAAICLVDVNGRPVVSDFNIVVNFDSTKNSCVSKGQSGTALDANPDFVGIGTGWNCSGGGIDMPRCGVDNSPTPVPAPEAYITCGTTDDNGSYATANAALAVIEWTANNGPTDALSFGTAAVYDSGGNVLRCPPAEGQNECLGATVTKEEPTPTPTATATATATATPTRTNTPTPTPTPQYPNNCDIGVGPLTANPPAVWMGVGDPPAIVILTNSWTNYGAVSPAIPRRCNFARAMGAQLAVTDFTVFSSIDPTKLGVRMEPMGAPPAYGYGDVCLSCTPWQGTKSIGDCLDPLLGAHGPFDTPPWPVPSEWTYMPVNCDEAPLGSLPFSTMNGSCEDGIDQVPNAGVCDWGGFSKLCAVPTTPDPYCVDVQAIGLKAAVRLKLSYPGETAPTPVPPNSVTDTRKVKIECRAPGVYPVAIFSGISQQTDNYAGGSNTGATDPNAVNDRSFVLIPVVCGPPEMVKDCNTEAPGIQTSCNLWLMNPKFPGGWEFDGGTWTWLPAADANGCVIADKGKGCLAVDVWLHAASDVDDVNDLDLVRECLGAWEHQVRYDHKIIRFLNNLNPAPSFLESTGRIANCSATVLTENWILEGCVTKDGPAPGIQNGPCGSGIVERMLVIPQTGDLIYRGVFRPTKDNGVVTNVVDDNCEITDIYAEPMSGTLPGGLIPVCGNMSITVRMLEGDLDLDCDVDVVDDQAIAFRYGSSWGLQLYDQWYDLEPKYADQDIDIKDLQFIFGRNYSSCQHPIPDDQSIPVPPAQPDP